jgi:hypothetical protein
MPNFWLGNTSGAVPSTTSNFHSTFLLAGGINAPEGINTLRFGGVDTNFTPSTPGATPLYQSGKNIEFVVFLGPPVAGGTSILVNQVITNASSTPSGTATATQLSASFIVDGRLNMFQANNILGDTDPGAVPTQFFTATAANTTPPASNLAGGTYVVSQAGGGTTTGQIGFVRIGGNATNFSAFPLGSDVFTFPSVDPQTGPQVSNFFIGGETNNVILVAPSGSRDVYFGRGMDNTKINTEFIQNLQANRGAIGSAVTVKRTIGNMVIGGDVVNTLIQSGYDQNLSAVANTPSNPILGVTVAEGVFNGEAPPTILNRVANTKFNQVTSSPLAHGGGAIHGRIAGNVTNSIISASVDPDPSGIKDPGQIELPVGHAFPFGAPDNIVLPHGILNIKVEGTVNNSAIQQGGTTTPANPLGQTNAVVDPNLPPTTAFFAKHLTLTHLPVIPPNVPEAPYPPSPPHRGQRSLRGLFKVDHVRTQTSHTTPPRTTTRVTPGAKK